MKRSFRAIQNVTQAVRNFFGIGPTTAQAQGAPNAQGEQALNQLAISSMTDYFNSTRSPRFFAPSWFF